MSEAALLRVLADRLEELEGLTHFPTDVTDPGVVTVQWTAGSDHPGYAVLSQAMSAMVEQHWNALRSQVVKKKEGEVQAARKLWREMDADPIAAPEADDMDDEFSASPTNSVPQQLSRVQLIQRQA